MSDVEINSNLERKNNININASNEIFLTQKNQWEEIKNLISKNIKGNFWKAWIKPLKFEKYENHCWIHFSLFFSMFHFAMQRKCRPYL